MLRVCVAIFLLFQPTPTITSPSVIIVGAGPAGIAAATKLFENSITNIIVLEAENRIGGRINSVSFVDGIVDLGAQYCHGEKDNIAYELAKGLNILEPSLRGFQNNVYYSNGSRLDSAFIQDLEELYHNYYEEEDVNFNTTGRSVGDLVIHEFNSTLVKKYEKDQNISRILAQGLRFLEGFIVVHEGSFSWFDVSAECDYTQCEGNQGLIWKGLGYKAILEIMMRSYPDPSKKLPIDDKIYLDTQVKKIIWNATQVEVITSNRIFYADYVIFTPSIGVLKQQKEMFHPPLPSVKKEAIEATGFAGVMKVFIYFPTKWWKEEDRAFAFYWQETLLPAEFSWVHQFRYILKVPDNPNVWVGWISGDLVPKIEKLSIEILRNGCEYVLKKFLGKIYYVTEIGKIVRSTWCTNQNFGGTYSFTKTGFYKEGFSYQKQLAEPLKNAEGKPALLFAGEATNPNHYSTVHGAIESGYREAERIIHLHKQQS